MAWQQAQCLHFCPVQYGAIPECGRLPAFTRPTVLQMEGISCIALHKACVTLLHSVLHEIVWNAAAKSWSLVNCSICNAYNDFPCETLWSRPTTFCAQEQRHQEFACNSYGMSLQLRRRLLQHDSLLVQLLVLRRKCAGAPVSLVLNLKNDAACAVNFHNLS